MNWTIEVVVIPVADVDRAKTFYADKLGFHVDHDTTINPQTRIVQLTPKGSGCSIVIGVGAVPDMPAGSLKGVQLVVSDLRRARAELVDHGVEVSEIQFMGPAGPRPATESDDLNNSGFVHFSDPDGNEWAIQQITGRAATDD